MAKNEKLRTNLLRAISHDLRTPLASISGNAGSLLSNYQKMDEQERVQAFTDIYDDAMWLINLVENLLAVTKIEEGKVNLNSSVEVMDEVITEALRHVNRRSREHTIRVTSAQELIPPSESSASSAIAVQKTVHTRLKAGRILPEEKRMENLSSTKLFSAQ